MTVREQIIKAVGNTEDSQLLREILAFLEQRQQQDSNRPVRGSREAILRHQGSISKEAGDEVMAFIDREFNNIEGEWQPLTPTSPLRTSRKN